jgi:outer membrane receptor protein involved in Fe transport
MNLGLKITKKLSFNLNLNGQYNIINATIDGIDLSNRGYNGFAKLMMQYKQNDKLSFQLNGNYESPEIIPQGRTISRYFIDLSLRKDFGNRWSMNLSANDLLNSKRWGTVIDTPGLRQTTSRRWDVRNYRINLTYKFGESDPAIFRKRSLRKIENGGGGGDEGF